MWTPPDWVWWAWLGFFLIVEGFGLWDNRKGGTFSEVVWKTVGVRDRRPTKLMWVLRVALAAFMVWLTVHFIFGV